MPDDPDIVSTLVRLTRVLERLERTGGRGLPALGVAWSWTDAGGTFGIGARYTRIPGDPTRWALLLSVSTSPIVWRPISIDQVVADQGLLLDAPKTTILTYPDVGSSIQADSWMGNTGALGNWWWLSVSWKY